jgi:hypothetical protein
VQINAATKDADEAAFRRSVVGQADLTLSTAHLQGQRDRPRCPASVVSPGFNLHDFDNVFVADTSLSPPAAAQPPDDDDGPGAPGRRPDPVGLNRSPERENPE